MPQPKHGRARARVARVVGDAHEDRHVASLRVATLGRCGQRAWVGFGCGCGCGFGFGFGFGFGCGLGRGLGLGFGLGLGLGLGLGFGLG